MKIHPKIRITRLLLILGLVITVPFNGFGQDHHGHKMEPSSSATTEQSSDARILGAYTKIHKALTSDSIEGVSMAAMELARMTHEEMPEVGKTARNLAQTETLDQARQAFGPLSQSLIDSIKDGKVDGQGFSEAYCPMAAFPWIQAGPDLQNPYYGSSMPHCGMIREKFGESEMKIPSDDKKEHSGHSH